MSAPPRVLGLGDRGLDLVLGGGLRWVEHAPKRLGTTVVLRGPAGAGKTLSAVHLALRLGEALGGDAGYACVELLPAELLAQARGIFEIKEDESPRLVPQLLEQAESAPTLGDALLALWQSPVWSERLGEGQKPKVLVVDSLIEGYGLGASVSREFADAVCKLAAQWGIALILVEEATPGSTSPWVYAADTVLELALATAPNAERQLTVRKHRYGPSDAGPHAFEFVAKQGVRVLPRPSAWLEPWAIEEVRRSLAGRQPNAQLGFTEASIGSVRGTVALLHGANEGLLANAARNRLRSVSPGVQGEVVLEFGAALPLGHRRSISPGRIIYGCAHPYLSAARLLHALLVTLATNDGRAALLLRVVLGDLAAFRLCPEPDELLRAVGAFCALMRECGIAVVLYESRAARLNVLVRSAQHPPAYFLEPELTAPRAGAYADVVLSLEQASPEDFQSARLVLRRSPPNV